jgi:hypothetical protein
MYTLYRICTESGHTYDRNTYDILNKTFDGYTVIRTIGTWKGQKENSLIIEILGRPTDRINVLVVCQKIKEANNQECILLEVIENVKRKFV